MVVRNQPGSLGVVASILGAHGANIVNMALSHRDAAFHTNLTALSWSIRNSVEVLLNEPIAQDPVGLAPELPSAPDIAPLLEAVRELHGIS